MSIFSFSRGLEFTRSGRRYRLGIKVEKGWQIENALTGMVEIIRAEELLTGYISGDIRLPEDESCLRLRRSETGHMVSAMLDTLPEETRNTVLIRRQFLEFHIRASGASHSRRVIGQSLAKFWPADKTGTPPDPATVSGWLRKYLASGRNVLVLAPAIHLRGNRTRRMDTLVEELCMQAIGEVYLTPERGTQRQTRERVIVLINAENKLRTAEYRLEFPSPSYIRSLIGRIPEIDRYAARYGKQAANHHFRNSISHAVCDRPLARAEVDHTRMDVIVVDEKTRLPVGRPWLTLIIDVFTKCILGFYLTFDPPSHATVARALRQAIMPKTWLKDDFPEVRGEYPVYGLMETLVTDNGLEFHCGALEAMCGELGIIIAFTPRKTPWWKGTVERVLGTLNRGVTSGMPGKTFSEIRERGEYDSLKKSVVSMRTLEACILKWIVDIYHETRHRSLNMTPREMWDRHMPPEAIRLPRNPERLDAVAGQIAVRTLWHYGIEINSLTYNSPELGELRQSMGDRIKLEIRWDSDDLGHIFVMVPGGGMLKVPVIPSSMNYATGLTLYQHELNRRLQSMKPEDTGNVVALAESRDEIRQMIEADMDRNKKKTRVRQVRALGPTKKAVSPVGLTPEPVVAASRETAGIPGGSAQQRPTFKALHIDREHSV